MNLYPDVTEDPLYVHGIKVEPGFSDQGDIARAKAQIVDFYRECRSRGLFYSADECRERGSLGNPNSGPRQTVSHSDNLMTTELSWVLSSETYRRLVRHVMLFIGPDIDIYMARVIVTVPMNDIPDYIKQAYFPIENASHGSLAPYMRPENLRAFFFIHNPLHQDSIDFPASDMNSLTTLIPLSDRKGDGAPLLALPGSAAMDPTPIPVRYKDAGGMITFENGGQSFRRQRIDANPGDLIAWHSRAFHMVLPNTSNEPVINLRFNFCPSWAEPGLRDKSSRRVAGRSAVKMLTERRREAGAPT